MNSIKEFFAQHTVSVKEDSEMIVHYQIYGNKELSSFQINASLLYLYDDFTNDSLMNKFEELKSFMEKEDYISSIKIDIDHEKECVSIDKQVNIEEVEIECTLFNETINLIKENAKDSYKIENLEAVKNVASLEKKSSKSFKILSNSDMLKRFKELSLEAYELREKNESLASMIKGLYNEKMSIYKSIIVSLILLTASGYFIAFM